MCPTVCLGHVCPLGEHSESTRRALGERSGKLHIEIIVIFLKAGLIMYNKDFNQFTWEMYEKRLDMRYFYFGRYLIHFLLILIHFFSSIYYIGPWQWCSTHSFYLGNILFEINVLHVLEYLLLIKAI